MKIAISGQALAATHSFAQIVRMGKRYGIRNYEIWPENIPGSGPGYAARDVAAIRQVTKAEGVSIDCLSFGGAFDPQLVADHSAYVAALSSAVTAAEQLGAARVNHYCFAICRQHADFDRLESYWTPALRQAETAGIVLVLENEAHDATATPRNMLEILQHFRHPNFKTNFDAVNYFHASEEGYPFGYELLKEYIGYVHLKNARLFQNGRAMVHAGAPMSGVFAPYPIEYTPLPDGAVNIAGLLYRIREEQQYDGPCTLEPHAAPEYVESFYRREIPFLQSLGIFNR